MHIVLSKQLLRSGTSIGANVKEAVRGQSKTDFIAKMCAILNTGLNFCMKLIILTTNNMKVFTKTVKNCLKF